MAYAKMTYTGIFAYADDFKKAVSGLLAEKYRIHTIYSPVPAEEVYSMLELKRSPIRFFTLAGAVAGFMFAFTIAIYTAIQWGFIIQGKPVIGWVSFCLVAYEITILAAVICTVAGVFLLGRLKPQVEPLEAITADISRNRYGLTVECPTYKKDAVSQLLMQNGAEHIYEDA